MNPQDSRHGTNAGYVAGCRDDCCRNAHARQRKRYRDRLYLTRSDALTVDATGTRRRIQALMALGWSTRQLDRRLGHQPTYVYKILASKSPTVYRTTALRIAALYDQLCMTPQPAANDTEAAVIRRNANQARRKGYVPPLAWDNIDDPDEQPANVGHQPRRASDVSIADEYDPAVVERILTGDYKLTASAAEKREVVRRWQLSHNELERRTKWKVERYIDREDGAA